MNDDNACYSANNIGSASDNFNLCDFNKTCSQELMLKHNTQPFSIDKITFESHNNDSCDKITEDMKFTNLHLEMQKQ